MKELLQDRLDTLRSISGLWVSCYKKTGVTYFVFGNPDQPVKTICTYPKAKMFAEGVAYGRTMPTPYVEN